MHLRLNISDCEQFINVSDLAGVKAQHASGLVVALPIAFMIGPDSAPKPHPDMWYLPRHQQQLLQKPHRNTAKLTGTTALGAWPASSAACRITLKVRAWAWMKRALLHTVCHTPAQRGITSETPEALEALLDQQMLGPWQALSAACETPLPSSQLALRRGM